MFDRGFSSCDETLVKSRVSVIQNKAGSHSHPLGEREAHRGTPEVGCTHPTSHKEVGYGNFISPTASTMIRKISGSTDNQDWTVLSDSALFAKFDDEFSYLRPILEGLPSDLTLMERRQIAELLLRNNGAFSSSEFNIGCTNLLQQQINTGNHPPISEPLRRHPRAHLDLIDETVDKLREAGVVEGANSPWSANVVLVKKKKDSNVPRVTIDYRKLNSITVKDKYPLPRIKDCLDALSGLFCSPHAM